MKMVRYEQGKVPPLTEDFWRRAVPLKDVMRSNLYTPKKVTVTAKLDADIVAWLKRQGRGYQTRMNAILRQAFLKTQH